MKRFFPLLTFVAALALLSPGLSADTIFTATLTGAEEVPPNASTATGFAMVVLSTDETMITVNVNFQNLITPASAGHIHGPATPGVNAPVLFPFAGVPAAISGVVPEQVFAITAEQVANLEAGLFYVNIHNSEFPGGEIRGQLAAIPEPSTMGLLAIGFGSFLLARRKWMALRKS